MTDNGLPVKRSSFLWVLTYITTDFPAKQLQLYEPRIWMGFTIHNREVYANAPTLYEGFYTFLQVC